MSPWLGMALTLGVLAILMAAIRLAATRRQLHPELSRKMVHVGMGITTLSFPWLFHSPWPVVALGLLSSALMISLKRWPALQTRFGNVIGGVERASLGDVYFPIAVAILFVASKGNPVLFEIPMMILTFGDATAALIGVRYGISQYKGVDGTKSLEGSIALFTVSFLAIHVPLLLLISTPRGQSLLIGLTIGLLATLLEAIAWNGLDNLFFPLGAYALLHTFLKLTNRAMELRFLVVAGLVFIAIGWRKRTTLNDTAVLGAALAGYACWAIGGWRWLLAPLLLFVTYTLLSPRTKDSMQPADTMASVLSVASVGLGWLFVANASHRAELLFPYTLSFAVQLALIGIARSRIYGAGTISAGTILLCVFKSWTVIFAPYALILGISRVTLVQLLLAFVVIVLAAIAFHPIKWRDDKDRTITQVLVQQACLAAIGSAVGFVAVGG